MNSSLGALKVGQTTIAGDITVCLGLGSSDLLASCAGAFFSTVPLSGDASAEFTAAAALVPTVLLSGSSDMEMDAVALRLGGIEHFDGVAAIQCGAEGAIIPIWRFDGSSDFVSSASCVRIIPIIWGAAIIIDFLEEPTYPMIVVNEAVEPTPTNTISVRAF